MVESGQGASPQFQLREHVPGGVVRVSLWFLAMVAAMTPVVSAAQARFAPSLFDMAIDINQKHLFKEFYYVIIVAAILTISNLVERLMHDKRTDGVWLRAVCFVGVVSLITAIFVCFAELSALPFSNSVARGRLWADVNFMSWVLTFSLVIEALSSVFGPR